MLKSDMRIGVFRILQFVGQGEDRSLYLASKGDDQTRHWLLESAITLAHLQYIFQETALWEHAGKNYLAFAVKGTSAATLARIGCTLDPAFIGWRWVELARDVSFLHKKGIAYQRNLIFSLEKITFDQDARPFLLSENRTLQDFMQFPAPELGAQAATPKADVYALGASLLFLLGEPLPNQRSSAWSQSAGTAHLSGALKRVLHKATAQDPAKRYPDANAFGLALADALPSPPRAKTAKPQGGGRILALGVVFLVLV